MFLFYYFWLTINYLIYLNHFFFEFLLYKSNNFNFIHNNSFYKQNFFNKFFFFFLKKENINSFSFFFKNLDNYLNFWKKNLFFPSDFFNFYSNRTKNKLFDVIFLTNLFKKICNIFKLKNYFDWLILQKIFFSSYFNLLNLYIYKNISKNNLIKFNFIIFFFLELKNYRYSQFFNLNYYNDWFAFSFNTNKKKNNIKNKNNIIIIFRKKKIIYLKKIISIYNSNYNFKLIKDNFFLNKLVIFNKKIKNKSFLFFKNIKIKNNFFENIKNNLPIRFFESSLNKFVNFYNFKNYNFYYLRKNKIFNKGRYSRNRQLYRTGVYWCLWLNIIIVYGLYFLFYRFSFNFGYIWFGLFIIFFSTIFSRVCKYSFFNFFILIKEFVLLFNWFGFILINFYNTSFFYLGYFFNKHFLLLFNKFDYNLYFLFFYINFIFNKLNKKKDYGYVFIWEDYKFEDKSFLKYKSILNWFVQLYKVLIY